MRDLITALGTWVCPPPLPGQEHAVAELQRRRISQVLPVSLLLGFIAAFVIFPSTAFTSFTQLWQTVVVVALLFLFCLYLCHIRRAQVAAWVYVSIMIAGVILGVLIRPWPGIPLPLQLTAAAFLPIGGASVFLTPRISWYIMLLFDGVVVVLNRITVPNLDIVIVNSLTSLGILFICTAMITLAMRGFSTMMLDADRSEELAALNEEMQRGIAELQHSQDRFAQQQAFLDSIIDNIAPDILLVTDRQDRILRISDMVTKMLGWEKSELQGKTTRIFYPDDQAYNTGVSGLKQHLRDQEPMHFELEVVAKQGQRVRLECNLRLVGDLNIFVTICRDITQRHAMERRLHDTLAASERTRKEIDLMRQVAHACASAADEHTVATAALSGILAGLPILAGAIIVNDPTRPGYAQILELQSTGAVPTDHFTYTMTHEPVAVTSSNSVLRALATAEPTFHQTPQMVAITDTDGEDATISHVMTSTVPLAFGGKVFGVFSLIYDAAAYAGDDIRQQELLLTLSDEIATSLHRARLYEEARRLALFDPLTGLHNHRALQDTLQQSLATGAHTKTPLTVIMLDVDHFRKFNEAYGHDIGDYALRLVAEAIQHSIRDGDSAARYGGEEFTVILPDTDTRTAGIIAERIRGAIAQQRVIVNEQAIPLTASLGFATFPHHASASVSLLKAADLALYHSKRSGRNCVTAYSPTLLRDQATEPLTPTTSIAPGEITLPTGADLEAVRALIIAIDLRDGYTAAHSDGVATYAVAIATALDLPAEHIEALRLGGLIHDVGKIGVPDHILCKPGKLSDEEWVLMRAHTTMGEEILRPVEQLRHLLPLVRWHHERLDGSGYPDGLRGEAISQLVRILSVADVYEAFTAERPYHPGRTAEEGLRFLQHEAKIGHLDSHIVTTFAAVLSQQGVIKQIDIERQAA